MVRTTAGQRWQHRIVSADQRFLLIASPTLDLSFRSRSVFHALENFVKNQGHRPPICRVTIKGTSLMFSDALLQAPARRSNIIRAVCATEDIKVQELFWVSFVRPSRRRLRRLL